MALLFTAITVAFAAIAFWSATAGPWPITLGAAALAVWMGSLAWTAIRKTRL